MRAELTALRLGQDHYRVIDGADAGHRDLTWVRRMAQDRGANVTVTDTTTQYGCLGVPVLAFRISYVGEQGWEPHFKYEDGLSLWDALRPCSHVLAPCPWFCPECGARCMPQTAARMVNHVDSRGSAQPSSTAPTDTVVSGVARDDGDDRQTEDKEQTLAKHGSGLSI